MDFSDHIKNKAKTETVSRILIREESILETDWLVIAAEVKNYRISIFTSTFKSWYTCTCPAFHFSCPCSHIYATLLLKDELLNARNQNNPTD